MASWRGGLRIPDGRHLPPSLSFILFPFHRYHGTPLSNVRYLQVLASYIERRGFALQGMNVLELGSGTGLVGLVAGHLGARVCITDQAYVAPHLPPPPSPRWYPQS
jgi:hypothetical protein